MVKVIPLISISKSILTIQSCVLFKGLMGNLIDSIESNLYISNSNFNGITTYCGLFNCLDSQITMVNNRVTGNKAVSTFVSGGGASIINFFIQTNIYLGIPHSTFSNNSAFSNGGIIYAFKTLIIVNHFSLIQHSLEAILQNLVGGEGSLFYILNSNLTISNIDIFYHLQSFNLNSVTMLLLIMVKLTQVKMFIVIINETQINNTTNTIIINGIINEWTHSPASTRGQSIEMKKMKEDTQLLIEKSKDEISEITI
ncbi:hypothetical protein ACTA71_004553 [Dictyostelium dimigraforme]